MVPSQDDVLAATISEDDEEEYDDEVLSTGEEQSDIRYDVGINIMRSSIKSAKRHLEKAQERESGTI